MGNMISSFFHPEDAYSKAEDAAKEGYNKGQGYQEPFRQGGVDQYGRLNDAAGKLSDPAALQNEWSKNYETSPYAQQLLKQNQSSGMDAASSMGLMGSSAALGNIQQGAGNIVSQDRQQYMDDLMKKYMSGIGLGENLYGVGANAAGQMGNRSMQQGENMAGLEYGKAAAPGKLFGQLAGAGIGAATGGLTNLANSGGLGSGLANGLFNTSNQFNG